MYSSSQKLIEEINKVKVNSSNDKNKNGYLFFKNKHKIESATQIANQFDLTVLLQNTCYPIGESNKVYFDYTVYKLYGNPTNYELLVNYIMNLYENAIGTYGSFELHMNLDGLTISAVERHKLLIEMFNRKCVERNPLIFDYMSRYCIYNSPAMVENIKFIVTPFVDKRIIQKVELFDKTRSSDLIENIHKTI